MPTFAEILEGQAYGFATLFALKVEGIPYLFIESSPTGAVAPTDYTIDASLVVDDSARVGSIVDRRTGLGRGFDFTAQFLDTAAIRELFQRPDLAAKLTADLAFDDVAAASVSTDDTGWDAAGTIYIGIEAITYTAKTGSPPTSFDNLTRGEPNGEWKGYDVEADSPISTWVTNRPLFWRGRAVKLYMIPVDPYGAVHGADVLSDAVVIWQGAVDEPPFRSRSGLWQFECRSFERRLTEVIMPAISGRGSWGVDLDQRVTLDDDEQVFLWAAIGHTNAPPPPVVLASIGAPTTTPWTGLGSGPWSAQYLRDRVRASFDTNVASLDTDIIGLHWRAEDIFVPGQNITVKGYRAYMSLTAGQWKIDGTVWPLNSDTNNAGFFAAGLGYDVDAGQLVDDGLLPTRLVWAPTVVTSLIVVVDQGDPSLLPSTGWLKIDVGQGDPMIIEYLSVDVQETEVTFQLNPDNAPSLSSLGGDTVTKGWTGELSVEVFASLDGRLVDLIREVILSSGRGDNDATYDVLERSQGYDIREVDTESFDLVMDGALAMIPITFWSSTDLSWAKMFGGWLQLSQRGIAPKVSNGYQLAAIHTSVADTATAGTSPITDADLVYSGKGGSPVRPKRSAIAPNQIQIKTENRFGKGTINQFDVVGAQQQGALRWTVRLQGIGRSEALGLVTGWATSLFDDARAAMAIEVDVVPWKAPDLGDVRDLSLPHFALWQMSTGAPGYVGPGRCIGVQYKLKSMMATVTFLIDGVSNGMSLSPAVIVDTVNGAAGNPNWIEVDLDYLALMQAYLASSDPFVLVVYDPSSDTNANTLNINAVADVGGACRLNTTGAVGGAPVVVAGTSWVTLPPTATANDAQDRHLHTDSDAQWR